MEKKPSLKLYGVFDHFSRTYEFAKFLMNKLYLDLSDVIHLIHGLYVNLWNLFVSICFTMKKNHFKQKFLLWPQVPFKKIYPYTKTDPHTKLIPMV